MSDVASISKLVGEIEKAFGKNAIGVLDSMVDKDVQFLNSGSIMLDLALGGGFPRGRIIEIFGPESSGKTTISMHAIATSQALGETCAFIDVEHAFDPYYAKCLGIDTSKLLFAQPDNGEQALEIVENLCKSGIVSVIVVDSVSALVPKAELEGTMTDASVATQARLMSKAMRKLTAINSKSGAVLIFINQLREKVGVMFGNPETTSGGNALKFYASQRLDVRRSSINKDKEGQATSNIVKVKVVKNKIAPPFREALVQIDYGIGINKVAEVLTLSVDLGLIKKSGSWYSYKDMKLGQGEAQVQTLLADNEGLVAELKALIAFKIK